MKRLVLLSILLVLVPEAFAQVKIGAAKRNITPDEPVWLSGYASRKKPSEGVLQDIWAKALVIEESSRKKVIIVTTDLIGISHELSADLTGRIMSKHGISRSQLILSSSHTHSGPVIWPGLGIMYILQDSDRMALIRYHEKLRTAIMEVVDEAATGLQEGTIMSGHGTAGFAINRRQATEKGVSIGLNPDGPVDHDVPVVKFSSANGSIIAILFGYACHNTTLNGQEINGDYAGFAQAEIEKRYPGTIAMYMAGCGADQNPDPRRTIEAAMKHGSALAEAVAGTVEGSLQPVRMPVRTAFADVELEFPDFDPERFRKELGGEDIFRRRRAEFLLQAYDRGYDLTKVTYPVQALRFGRDLTIVALAGEVVVDYSLNTKKRYPGENLFVAGYCSEVPCYIPSVRIIREGGYEPDDSMIYFGLPGPFKENVEEKVTGAITKVMRKVGVRR